MKPTSRCQGQGIFIIDKLAQVAPFRHKTTVQQPPPPPIPPKPPIRPRKEVKPVNPPSEDE